MELHEKVLTYSAAFCMVAVGVLVWSYVPSALEMRNVHRAQKIHLLADANRMMSLAKTYDAKAAAMQVKTLMKEIH